MSSTLHLICFHMNLRRSSCSNSVSCHSCAAIKLHTGIENIYEFWELVQFSPFYDICSAHQVDFSPFFSQIFIITSLVYSNCLRGEPLTYLLLCQQCGCGMGWLSGDVTDSCLALLSKVSSDLVFVCLFFSDFVFVFFCFLFFWGGY